VLQARKEQRYGGNTMSNFTFDDNLETRMHQLREIGKQYAEAKRNLVFLEHSRKILLSKLMKEYQLNCSTGKLESIASQEREARSDKRYEKHIESLAEAVRQESELSWQREIVRINFETWKTKMINSVVEKKHYG
jgi:hypothetical protein